MTPTILSIKSKSTKKRQDHKVPVVAPTISSEFANRVLMTRQEGDTYLYEASLALGAREFLKASDPSSATKWLPKWLGCEP